MTRQRFINHRTILRWLLVYPVWLGVSLLSPVVILGILAPFLNLFPKFFANSRPASDLLTYFSVFAMALLGVWSGASVAPRFRVVVAVALSLLTGWGIFRGDTFSMEISPSLAALKVNVISVICYVDGIILAIVLIYRREGKVGVPVKMWVKIENQKNK